MIRQLLTWGTLLVFFGSTIQSTAATRDKVTKPKLTDIVKGKGWKVVNRKVSLIDEGGKKGVRFDDKADVGIAWLDGYEFRDGTIEFDVKGKSVLQKSFVGIAFQASNDDARYDVIYFRPFNFKSDDPVRRGHAVQYISSPDHDWKPLRETFPNKYEQPVDPAPDPDGWFHARIVIDGKKVSVFVNAAAEPSLVVEKLTESRSGKIGLWVGDQSDGSFANLKITPNDAKTGLKETLTNLEKQSWEAWKDRDGKFFARFLSDDHVEVGTGGPTNKTLVVAFVGSPVCVVRSYKLDNFTLTQLDAKTAVLTYHAEQDTTCGGSQVPSPVWVGSLYVNRGGRWYNAFYQQTQAAK